MLNLIIAVSLAAQADSATAPAQPEPLTIGVTKESEVTGRLGRPNSTSVLSDGTKIVVYMSSKTKVKGTTFVPIVGLFAGGAKSRMVIRTFAFGPDGVLRNYSTTDSAADCSTGLFSASCK